MDSQMQMSTDPLCTSAPTDTPTDTLVDCYNCRGANTRLMCGFAMYGCDLCKTYGDGSGHIYSKFRNIEVVINGKKYVPPAFSCLECQDTKKSKYTIWDSTLANDRWSDYGAHNMPKVTVACRRCEWTKHESELKDAEVLYFKTRDAHKNYFNS